MKRSPLLFLAGVALASCGGPSASSQSSALNSSAEEPASTEELTSVEEEVLDYHPEGYSLTWSDEFDGNALSTDDWGYEIGNNNGWGNNELEYYTDHNERVENGLLTITAKAEETVDDDKAFHYTSSRLLTRHKRYFTYGYMCARIRLPLGTGLWPAFWMMPEKNFEGEGHTWWPTPGEIDIMEAKGRLPENASGALHYSSNGLGGNHTYQAKEDTGFGRIDDFHVYAIEWTDEKIVWLHDGNPFFTVEKSVWNRGYGVEDDTPFNKDFFFILNLAVGGNFDGGRKPDDTFESADMDVDFVRCYQI